MRDEIGGEAAFAGGIFGGGDGDFVGEAGGNERGFDCVQIHALALDFDDVIRAAEMFERTVGEPFAEVGGDEHAELGMRGVGAEFFGGQRGLAPVALAEVRAADGDAAFGAGRGGLVLFVEQQNFDAGDWGADGDAGTSNVERRTLNIERKCSDEAGFGGAERVHQPAMVGAELAEGFDVAGRGVARRRGGRGGRFRRRFSQRATRRDGGRWWGRNGKS